AQRKDRADVLGEAGGRERHADLGADAPQDDRLLDAPVPLDAQVLDDDAGVGARRHLGKTARRHQDEQCEDSGEKQSPRSGHRSDRPTAPRSAGPPAQCSARASGESGTGASRKTKFSPATSNSIRAPSETWPRTMDSASGSSRCFWMVRRSWRAPYVASYPLSTSRSRAAWVGSTWIPFSESCLLTRATMSRTIAVMSSRESAWNTMMSSMRLRNSGRNARLSSSRIRSFILSCEASSPSD